MKINAINQTKIGVILNYITIFVNTVVGLLYTPYMLRKMGQSEYGLYSLVASVIAYLYILDLGFGNAIIRYTAKFRAEGKIKEQYEMFGMFLLLYLGIGLLCCFIGGLLYLNVSNLFGATMTDLEMERARIMMFLLTLNLAFTFPMSIWGAIINAYEHFVFPRLLNIIRIVLNTAVMIVLLSYGYKAVAMVVVQTVFNVLTLVLSYLYCKFELRIKILFARFDKSLLREISIYSFWIFIAAIVDRIYLGSGQFVLGAFVGTIGVAVFSVAMTLEHMYQSFSTAISAIFLPKITAMVTRSKNDKEISDLFIRTGRVQFFVLAYILSAFIVFGRQFVKLWAGDGYNDVYLICLLMFVPGVIPLCQNMGISIMQARNQMKFRSLCYLILAIGCIFIQILLVKPLGAVGCAIGLCISTVLGHIIAMNLYYYKKQRLDIPRFYNEILRMSVVPMVFTLFFYLFFDRLFLIDTWTKFAISTVVFTVLYLLFSYNYQINKDERVLFAGAIQKYKLKNHK